MCRTSAKIGKSSSNFILLEEDCPLALKTVSIETEHEVKGIRMPTRSCGWDTMLILYDATYIFVQVCSLFHAH